MEEKREKRKGNWLLLVGLVCVIFMAWMIYCAVEGDKREWKQKIEQLNLAVQEFHQGIATRREVTQEELEELNNYDIITSLEVKDYETSFVKGPNGEALKLDVESASHLVNEMDFEYENEEYTNPFYYSFHYYATIEEAMKHKKLDFHTKQEKNHINGSIFVGDPNEELYMVVYSLDSGEEEPRIIEGKERAIFFDEVLKKGEYLVELNYGELRLYSALKFD